MVQAAEIIGQLERQHGNDPIRQIYGSTPPIRFIIQKGAFGYIAGYIGYVDTQGEMTIFLLFAVNCIVQILGIRAVDGDNRHISIICHPFFRYNGARQIVRLLHEVIGKYMGQTMLGNDDINIKALIAFVTDDFRHLAFRIGTTHADYFHDSIPCTPDMTEAEVKGNYELETGNVIVKKFQDNNINPDHTPGVLVKNHGPFSWGTDADNAVYNAVVMEQVAKMAFVSFSVNPNTTMNPLLVEKHFSRKHGPNAYYGQKKKK